MPGLSPGQQRRWRLHAAEGDHPGQDQPRHRHRLHRQPLRQVDTKLLRASLRESKDF